jgi:hypothetical protein
MQLAASRMQHLHGRQSHATFAWPPVACNICMAASRMQHFHALAASAVQSRQFFSIPLREQL